MAFVLCEYAPTSQDDQSSPQPVDNGTTSLDQMAEESKDANPQATNLLTLESVMQSNLISLVKSSDQAHNFSETFLISLVHLYFKLHLKSREKSSRSQDVQDTLLFDDLLQRADGSSLARQDYLELQAVCSNYRKIHDQTIGEKHSESKVAFLNELFDDEI